MTPTHPTISWRTRLRDERGQSAVEFGLIFPVIAAVVFLVVQFGIAFVHWNNVTQLAGDAARFAAVNKDPQQAITDGGSDLLKTGGGNLQGPPVMSVCFPSGTGVGNPVVITITTKFDPLPLVSTGVLTLKGKATMRLERPATFSAPACTP